MNWLGKVFVVLILLMSVIFMALSMAVYATHKNWTARNSAAWAAVRSVSTTPATRASRATRVLSAVRRSVSARARSYSGPNRAWSALVRARA